jgi:hypothetical protein
LLGIRRFCCANWHVVSFLCSILICKVTHWAPVELSLVDFAISPVSFCRGNSIGKNWYGKMW